MPLSVLACLVLFFVLEWKDAMSDSFCKMNFILSIAGRKERNIEIFIFIKRHLLYSLETT